MHLKCTYYLFYIYIQTSDVEVIHTLEENIMQTFQFKALL